MLIVKDVMRADSVHIHPKATLLEAAEKMIHYGVDALPVAEGDQLIGVIRLADLLTAPRSAHYDPRVPENRDEAQLLEIWKFLPVRNIMNDQAISVSEDTSLMKAAAVMVNNGRQRLPVLRDGKVVGMITRADVVRALLMIKRV